MYATAVHSHIVVRKPEGGEIGVERCQRDGAFRMMAALRVHLFLAAAAAYLGWATEERLLNQETAPWPAYFSACNPPASAGSIRACFTLQ